jgi:PAS domain S-box-containing protein
MEHEIVVDERAMIVTRTDTQGVIEYANYDFCEVSGYALNEIVGKPHNIIRHPDMPAVIFKLMWQRIKNGQDIFAVVKNRAKNGNFYWVTTKFSIRRHVFENHIIGFIAYRQKADPTIVQEISKLYTDLLAIEKDVGIEASEKFLYGFLDTMGHTYDSYIEKLALEGKASKGFFSKMISLFK